MPNKLVIDGAAALFDLPSSVQSLIVMGMVCLITGLLAYILKQKNQNQKENQLKEKKLLQKYDDYMREAQEINRLQQGDIALLQATIKTMEKRKQRDDERVHKQQVTTKNYLEDMQSQLSLMAAMSFSSNKDRLKFLCEDALHAQYIDINQLENVTSMYHSYCQMGGNSFILELYAKVLKLPHEKPKNQNKEI